MPDIHELIRTNDLVRRAYELAAEAHRGEKRKNGEAYLDHCVATAETVALWDMDEETIAAALLHDALKRAVDMRERIAAACGSDMLILLERLGKVTQVKYNGLAENVDTLRKLILYLASDVRVLLVRLASRRHNLQSLYVFPEADQKRMALETMDLYAPLSRDLGMEKLAAELEDLSFPYLYPQEHNWLMERVRALYEDRERYLEGFAPIVRSELERNGVRVVDVHRRAKHYASLYRKLLRYDMDVSKVHDLVALRVIVPTITDCYTALGAIHKTWPPLPGRIKDYIAAPKANGYRCLHTTVLAPGDTATEIQIRTQDMHRDAELGIAAHVRYAREKGSKAYREGVAARAAPEEIAVVRQLREWRERFAANRGAADPWKIDLFRDRVFALTPKGDVIELPKGATPVDFSYKIHSEVGNRAVGAKVNGVIARLDSELRSGDVVEILMQKNKQPSASWLSFVKTAAARTGIRAALRKVTGFLARERPQSELMAFAVATRGSSGGLKDISGIFEAHGVRIRAMEAQPATALRRTPVATFTFARPQEATLAALLADLKKLKQVKEVKVRAAKLQ